VCAKFLISPPLRKSGWCVINCGYADELPYHSCYRLERFRAPLKNRRAICSHYVRARDGDRQANLYL